MNEETTPSEEQQKAELKGQMNLFPDLKNEWEKEWKDMPEFKHVNSEPCQQIIVSFMTFEDVKKFGKLIGYNVITPNTKNLWFPKKELEAPKNYLYVDE